MTNRFINKTKTMTASSTSQWFSPAPSALTAKRLSLDFGLRSADLYFRDQVVPGIGNVWFVRQFSWPLAALQLSKTLGISRLRPAEICYGIEALACKLEFMHGDSKSTRVLGRRAFGRDNDGDPWAFSQLRKVTNYVRNTHRQTAMRAIRSTQGLGFAQGTRFDQFELEPIGQDLAREFLDQRVGQGRGTLGSWLREWIENRNAVPSQPTTLLVALSPESATKKECEIVRSRLLGVKSPECETRKFLAQALEVDADLPDIEKTVVKRLRQAGRAAQADMVLAARAFGAMLDRARDAVASLTRAVEPERGDVKLTKLGSDSAIKKSIKKLQDASKNYIDKANTAAVKEATSRSFADAVTAGDDEGVIRFLAGRSGEVLGFADDSVTRGSLFRIVNGTDEASDLEDGASSIEPDRAGRTFRIANFHALLHDTKQGGAR
jgi:hypothetical protein